MEPLAGARVARVSVVIPALNEEEPIGDVVRAIPRGSVDEILVVDNGSTDATAERAGRQDFVIGSRIRGRREPGSMNPQQLAAGWVAGLLLRLLYGVRYSDMCPFRAIRRDALESLGMAEETYGWNLEMQMRAAKAGLRILELPVDHRNRRGGHSKVSGNLTGSLRAMGRITLTFLRLARDLRSPVR